MRFLKSTLRGLSLLVALLTAHFAIAQVSVNMTWTPGTFPTEPGWQVVNTATNAVVFCEPSGGVAPTAGTTVLNLAPGTYQVRQFDSFGDGWNGGTLAFSKACTGAPALALGTYTGPPNAGFNPGANTCPGPTTPNGVSSNIAPATFTVAADNNTCVVTAPASVTVNSLPGVCGALVTLPIATSMGCGTSSLQALSSNNFTAGTAPAGWTITGSAPAGGVIFNATTVNAAGAPANANIVGNHLRFDDDAIGAAGVLNAQVTTEVVNIPVGATSPSLKFNYSFNEFGGIPLETANVEVSLNGGAFASIPGFPLTVDLAGDVNYTIPAGTTSIQVRFSYNDGGDFGWSFDIDNVVVDALIANPPPIVNNQNTGGANASGVYPVGTTSVVYTVSPGAGQCPATATTSVTVLDVEPPITANCPANISINLNPGECNRAINWTAPTFTDNCTPNPPVTLVSNGGGTAGLINTNIGQAVIFYDIKNTNNYAITLNSVDVLKRQAATFNIWRTTTATTYVGNEAIAANWTQIGTGAVGAGVGLGNVPVNANTLVLQPGQSVGICVQATIQVAGGPQIVGAVAVAGNTTYAGPQRRVLAGVEFTYGVLTNLAGGAAFNAANGNFGQIAGFPSTSYSAFMGNMNWTSLPVTPVLTSTPLNGTQPFKPGDIFPTGTTLINYTATDAFGNSSVCSFNVVVTPSTLATTTLACQDQVNISTDPATCTSTLLPAQFLKGGPFQCLDNYILEAYNGTNLISRSTIAQPAVVPANFAGKTVMVKVYDAVNTNNYCWGTAFIEDKTAPVITCPANLTIDDCSVDAATATSISTSIPFTSTNPVTAFVGANIANIPVNITGLPATALVQNIRVRARFTTTDWISNIAVSLVTPTGVVIPLKTAAAAGGCNAATSSPYDFTFTTAAVNGPLVAATPCASITAWNNGNVLPVGSLAPALGLPVNGNWIVRFADADNFPTNTVIANGVTLEITTTVPLAGATAVDACSGAITPTLVQSTTDFPCGNPLLRRISRTYKATDAAGNTAVCTQTLSYRRPTLATIVFPADVNLDCTYDNLKTNPNDSLTKLLIPAALNVPATNKTWFDAAGNPSPVVTGRPSPSGGSCNGIVVDYQDMRLDNICGPGLGYTIMRTWKVYDACANALTTKAQQVTVKDNTAPVIVPVATLITSTAVNSCKANVQFNRPSITDNCSSAAQLTFSTEIFTNVTGSFTVPTITAASLPVGTPSGPNQFSDVDLSPVSTATGLPRPIPYVVRYTATDACGNATTALGFIAVMDITAPVAVCPPTIKVSLSEDGTAFLTGKEIDRGSYDNCTTISKFEVRRMATLGNCSGKDINEDGDFEDELVGASGYDYVKTFYNFQDAAPFTSIYLDVEGPEFAMVTGFAGLIKNDNFNMGVLERTIERDLILWPTTTPAVLATPYRPNAVAYPNLYISGLNTVIFNNVQYTFVFNGLNQLISVTPTLIYVPAFSLTQPFTTKNLIANSNYTVDPDPLDVYGDFNMNGLADDEEYQEYNYYNFYHPEVKFCCEDAGDTIMVAMRIWDSSIYKHATNNNNVNHSYYKVGYPRSQRVRGNVNICMVNVIVEDKLAPKVVAENQKVFCGSKPAATAWLDANKPGLGSYNAPMSNTNMLSQNTAVALPAGGNADIQIPVSGLKSIKDLNVALQFFHTEIGNLTVTLTSPKGTAVTLFASPLDEKNGEPYTSAQSTNAASRFCLKFDDEPTLSVTTAIPFQSLPGVPKAITTAILNRVNGAYLAGDALSLFDGENPNGTWTISFVSNDPSSAGAGAVIAGGAQLWITADREVMNAGYFYDNCDDITLTYTDSGDIDNCGVGMITRTWTITDKVGRTGTTAQTYMSSARSAYKVTFPEDREIVCNDNKVYGTDPAQSGKPTVTPYDNTCPLVGVEFTDDTLVVNGLDESCFKIIRTWKILNWCQPLNLNADKVQRWNTPACSPTNLEPRTFINIDYAAWPGKTVAEVNAILGECSGATYDEDGYMEYVQIIKVVDKTAPTWKTVGTPTLEAVGKECKVKLTIPASEANDCTGKINYTYDIVAANNIVVATGGASGTKDFTEAEFGNYIVRYRAADNCGNVVTTDVNIVVKDAKKPTPVCFNGLAIDLMPTTGNVMLAASAFDAGSYDNCNTPELFVQLPGQPSAGATAPAAADVDNTASGMTTLATPSKVAKNAMFDCVGLVAVRLWARDAAGNWDYCDTYIDVQNNMGAPNVAACPPITPTGNKIATAIATEKGLKVENVEVNLSGAATIKKYTSATGVVDFQALLSGSKYTVTPVLDKNPLNGVSTLDLVLMSKHILGVQPLTSNYQWIAADVNKNGTISTADIVELRKMILAIQSNFTKNTSWRFADKQYQFPANNPLSAPIAESKFISTLNGDANVEFVAVKVGDVNGNASTNGQAVGRGAVGTFNFNVDEKSFNAGEEVHATFKANELNNILGYQFTLGYDKSALDLLTIEGNEDNFGMVEAGAITTSWNGAGEGQFTVVFKAKRAGNLSEMLNINSRYTSAEAYTKDAENLNVAIKYSNAVAGKMELYQNQPNPFIGRTVIGFNLTKAESAKLTIYDATGRILKSIEKDFVKGYNEVSIEDINAVGVLKYTLSTSTETATKSMIILE
jgi:HYR domain/Dockerin type I domain/Proprotein convertase P-domain